MLVIHALQEKNSLAQLLWLIALWIPPAKQAAVQVPNIYFFVINFVYCFRDNTSILIIDVNISDLPVKKNLYSNTILVS